MSNKAEIYSKINSRGYLRFELNESNEKEYLNKLISVQKALKDVEEKNQQAYCEKLATIENLKENIKDFYFFIESANEAETEIVTDFEKYIEEYIKPLNELKTRKEKLQLQVTPYVTDGVFQKFKAFFSHEGRTKLAIEKQFNKELKSVSKEIKDQENIIKSNPLNFDNKDLEAEKAIVVSLDLDEINNAENITTEEIKKFKNSVSIAKDIAIKGNKKNFVNKILDYIEICTEYSVITDLNVEEHYKFKNTEYKLYLQFGYLDNDLNSIVKYLETLKSEKDFVGEQAANKLIDGIQECISLLDGIVNEKSSEELKLA